MSKIIKEQTQVVIIGAGVSGLTVANFLRTLEISCIVLERQSLSHIEQRQRAGTVEARAVHMFDRWGFGDAVIAGPPYQGVTEFRLDGKSHMFTEDFGAASGLPSARMIPQQLLVRSLIKLIHGNAGDLRFDTSDIAIADLESSKALVSYRDADGNHHEITCDYIAGCDGFHGVSRTAIPADILKTYSKDHGIAWLNILTDARPRLLMAMGEHGFAAQFPRGPMSRIYLECAITDTEADWPDDRIRDALRQRFNEPDFNPGTITDKLVFGLRSVVFEPMRHGRLMLVGDSAHIISPVGGKGMNLALFDAEAFVLAVRDALKGDHGLIDAYSDTCLRRTWSYQEFSDWLTQMLHAAGHVTPANAFQRKLMRARFDRMMTSGNSARFYSGMIAGLD